MKPKELLYSLDHVGEDLLSEAEQTVLARKHRPWAGAAAAVLLLALGAGGFFLWKSLRGGVNPAATGEPGGTTAFRLPTDEPDPPSTEPDRLTVGDCWTGLSRARFDDLDRSLAGSLAAEYEGLTSLPVYERDASRPYSGENLVQRLYEAAGRIGVSADDGYDCSFEEAEDGTMCAWSCSCTTDQGTLTVYADGRIQMLYDEAHSCKSLVEVEFPIGISQEAAERILRYARMQDCGEELAERLGLGECGFVPCDRWDPTSSAWTAFTIYPLREDPAERLVSRWFARVQMLTNDGQTLRGFVLDRLPGETDAEAPEGLRLLGNYPIRSAEEAFAAFQSGSGLFEEPLVELTSNSFTPTATLIYLPESSHGLLMPFYRFWVPARAEADCAEYSAVYIPAIIDACLSDWPVKEGTEDEPAPAEDPTEPDEPQPTETSPDPTEPPDGYQPMLTRLEDGRYGVAGPAGTVEALSYMGPPDREPVWADLDGDGFRELIYWCNGPTSGVFTVGLCVYGLEEGWPVLEASGIYVLSFGEISLSEQSGSVFFHHTPWQYVADPDAEGGVSAVPGEERVLTLTLRDGTLLFNGSTSPDGSSAWGGPEYGWFGSSFNRLKAEVRDRCVFNHWACLVWTEPSAASAPTAGPRVFAAVTDNSHTVTGLLRYVPNQDGTWTCLMRGIEPIKAPEDPEALMGLTPEQVTERLGPCHFDMGSGLYIPCWFTEDCRMLTVHIQGVVDRVELRDLTALGD